MEGYFWQLEAYRVVLEEVVDGKKCGSVLINRVRDGVLVVFV